MALDPQARFILDAVAKAEADGRPRMETLSPDGARRMYRDARGAMSPDPPEVGQVEELTGPGPGGPIRLRYYRPLGSVAEARLPVLVYFHGGGWVFGDLDTHDVIGRQLANAGGFAVVSVDYRMGPESKFPAAVDDASAIVRWVADGADGRPIDCSRLAVGGDSAGGNLAAVVSILARDRGPDLSFQALLYPATNLERDTRSHADFAEGYLLTGALQQWCKDHYLATPGDAEDWRASPLLAADLSGLPPAYVMTAGYDPLRDEGQAYAERLETAGVPVAYRCFEGQIHGFLTMGRVIDEADVAIAEVAAHIRQTFDERSLPGAATGD